MRQNQPTAQASVAQPVVGVTPQPDDEPDVGTVMPARLSLSQLLTL